MFVNNSLMIERLNTEGTHFRGYRPDQYLVQSFVIIIDRKLKQEIVSNLEMMNQNQISEFFVI
jgi:hypothetical protein